MSVSDKIFQMYQRFFEQKHILTEAPALTIDINTIGTNDFPQEQALREMNNVASYLMGHTDIQKISFNEQVKIVKNAYQEQPFWQKLLFDYLNLTLDVEEARLKKEGEDLQDELEYALYKLQEKQSEQEELVNSYAQKIREAGFHVDANNLIQNYFKMLKRDKDEAWKVLTTNPAYFSPIITQNGEKQILSPAKAIDENKRLAVFLKGLKG